ncbi:flavodoxin family protein [Caproiciproducens sp. CPB-2]|uniref:flavodoxin family protein n=1 Tax=Caproiciproducens sp. CPB-2 TaxID=3030017 RepID=UPI0023DA83E5|nr:hypothetical protein [Caproiciproducens sp. CPB-2]MDF1495343.1 hypothetical protein [Caproiciproducens sp. CPB-2]
MNIAVVSYSYTGNNEALAESVAKELMAKHIKVSVKKPITMGSIVMDMLFSRTPKVLPAPDILRQYDFILFFGPVWMGQAASPLRAYLDDLKQNPKPYGFLSISGGADGGNPKLSNELLRRTGKQPSILIDQHIAELISPDNPTSRKETSAYRINKNDVNRLTKAAVERIRQSSLYNL